jgi:hypothetical protein
VGLNSLKSLNLTNVYPNNNNNNNNNKKNNKVKSKPLELFELAGKKLEKITNCWRGGELGRGGQGGELSFQCLRPSTSLMAAGKNRQFSKTVLVTVRPTLTKEATILL